VPGDLGLAPGSKQEPSYAANGISRLLNVALDASRSWTSSIALQGLGTEATTLSIA
jgi:hypothetical protein